MLYSQPTFPASSRLYPWYVRVHDVYSDRLILHITQHANVYKEFGLRLCEIDYIAGWVEGIGVVKCLPCSGRHVLYNYTMS